MKKLIFKIVVIRILSLMIIIFIELYKKYRENISYYVIINRGKIDFSVMLKRGYDVEKLINDVRRRKIENINDIDYGVIDSKNRLFIFLKENNYPIPIIIDGVVDEDSLIQINKNKEWLIEILNDEGYYLKDIFYSFYKNEEIFFIRR